MAKIVDINSKIPSFLDQIWNIVAAATESDRNGKYTDFIRNLMLSNFNTLKKEYGLSIAMEKDTGFFDPTKLNDWTVVLGFIVTFFRKYIFNETKLKIELVKFVIKKIQETANEAIGPEMNGKNLWMWHLLFSFTGLRSEYNNFDEINLHQNLLVKLYLFLLTPSIRHQEFPHSLNPITNNQMWSFANTILVNTRNDCLKILTDIQFARKQTLIVLRSKDTQLIRTITSLILFKKRLPNGSVTESQRDFVKYVIESIRRRRKEGEKPLIFDPNDLYEEFAHRKEHDKLTPIESNPYENTSSLLAQIQPLPELKSKTKVETSPFVNQLNNLSFKKAQEEELTQPSVKIPTPIPMDIDQLPIAVLQYGQRRKATKVVKRKVRHPLYKPINS